MGKELEKLLEIDRAALGQEVAELLMSTKRVRHSKEKAWAKQFPKQAGVYAIFISDELKYIGETANLQERMGEMHRTYMHSFRRKLGKLVLNAKLVKNKFSEEVEAQLDEKFRTEVSVAVFPLHLGRKEVEDYLVHYNERLLNSLGKRNKTKAV